MSCLARPDGKRQLTGAPTQAYVVILIHQRDILPGQLRPNAAASSSAASR
jgi:hypothetical protein